MKQPMTTTEIAATTDEDLDFTDIPDLPDESWRNARGVKPDYTAHYAKVEKALRDLLEAYSSYLTEEEMYDATEFLAEGEYGLALDVIAHAVRHNKPREA